MVDYFVHPDSNCLTKKIGSGTRIWKFTTILEDVIIGSDCNICDFVFIENDVLIGNNVTIKCGVYLWSGTTIESDVFIGPNATFTNDVWPKSGKRNKLPEKIWLKNGCSVGANSTILPGLIVGENSMIAAGSVVTRDVPQNVLVRGNPAKIIREI